MCHKYTVSYKCVDCAKVYRILPEQEKICEDAKQRRRTCKTPWKTLMQTTSSGRCNKCMQGAGCVMRDVGDTGREYATRVGRVRDDSEGKQKDEGLDYETEDNYGLYN